MSSPAAQPHGWSSSSEVSGVAAAPSSRADCGIDLYWLPLGAGGWLVPRCGRTFERVSAARENRSARPLYHSALEVVHHGMRYVIEMAPAWSCTDPSRGVVVVGPVGAASLGRLKAFRYEVRCWPGGVIPDRAWAVESPQGLTDVEAMSARVLSQVANVPPLTWGRDDLRLGDMWNSNSVVAWLLSTCGLDAAALVPPGGGRAPGWHAGVAMGDRVALENRGMNS